MPTITYNGNTYTCAVAIKGKDFIELRDADGSSSCRFGGISDFSAFAITDGDWSDDPGEANVRAAAASLQSGNIVLTVNENVGTTSHVTFVAPCDCSKVTGGLVVDGCTYSMVNSVGRTVTGVGGVFCSGAPVSVLLDKANLKAYLLSGPANITWGTADLQAGVSALPTGQLYLVYE